MRFAFAWAAVLAIGCTSAAPLQSRLAACELITEGDLPRLPLYAPDACYERCLAAASCEQLEAALCRSDVSLLVACDQECAFACDDGGLVAVEAVCDGTAQCAGGEDEAECPVYVCDDGTEIGAGRHRCNGWAACPDGSDEAGCPEPDPYVCDDGERVYPTARCDGFAACRDGSDEVGCAEPTWTCPG